MGNTTEAGARSAPTGDTQPVTLTATEFLNVAGHELRAPVTALKGQLQLMQRRVRRESGRERDDEALTKMLYQIERMQQLVAIYLDAAYLAERGLNLMRQPSDLAPLAQRITALYAIASPKHPVRLEGAEEPLAGQYDAGRVDMALRELLGNALKYSTEGEIVVRLRRENGHARVEVEDLGPTIAPEDAERIFDAYQTGAATQNTGLGLGLYVARQVARLHGGEMGVRPSDAGGNIFWFTLPLDEAA